MSRSPESNDAVDRDHSLVEITKKRQLQALQEISGPAARADDDDVIDLREYWRVILRRRWTIFTMLAIAVVGGFLVTFLTTPIYRASLLMQIEPSAGKVVEYDSVAQDDASLHSAVERVTA